jgi:hypothetical protein
MADVVTFWLDNKNAAGTKTAQHGDQMLVSYRDRYYVVKDGSAVMKGGKPLRYSQTSLPGLWKMLLRGDFPPTDSAMLITPVNLEKPTVTRKPRVKKIKEVSVMPEALADVKASDIPVSSRKQPTEKTPKAAKKSETKQPVQTAVSADCPYCNQKHEIPVEKGRSGKPFFLLCTKCKSEFAVRFVQVTMYQAQVAGFR